MAVLISCQELEKAYSARPLFEGLTFGIAEGERLGLLGANGSGKSTLLKLLAGLETLDRGIIAARRGLRVGAVAQAEGFGPGLTVQGVLEQAVAGSPLDEREKALRVTEMLRSAGFSQPALPVETLSGGWRKRLAIAAALISSPELLLLDEPTNHLDLGGILWLEQRLREAEFAFVLVSHDRRLLEKVTNRVVELSPAYEEGFLSVNGPYSGFLSRREEYLQAQAHRQEALASRVRRELEWLRQSAPARSTKAGARIRQAGQLRQELAQVSARNAPERGPAIGFDATGRKSRELLVACGIGKRLGGRLLFEGLELALAPGRRLGLLGPNGSGKTTLLRVFAGEMAPDRGTVRRAEGLQVVYFDQDRERVDAALPLQQALAPVGETVIYRGRPFHLQAWARRFLFRPEQLGMPVGELSGGEQARVLIARMMLEPADLLILDEPTNDLDIPTLEVLEESLIEFPGAVVLVTHDRAMLDGVCTEILALDGRGGARLFADYDQWERARPTPAVLPEAKAPKPCRDSPRPAAALTHAEQRELGRIEEKIEAAERAVRKIQAEMGDPSVATDAVRLHELWNSLQAAEQRVTEIYARWEELETRRSRTGG